VIDMGENGHMINIIPGIVMTMKGGFVGVLLYLLNMMVMMIRFVSYIGCMGMELQFGYGSFRY